MSDTGLFNEFPGVSAEQWEQNIQSDLQGTDDTKTLVWHSPEGIAVKPFYTAEDTPEPNTIDLPENHSWKIAQALHVTHPDKANAKAQECLEQGVESLVFTLPKGQTDFKTLLSNIDLENTPLHLNFQDVALRSVTTLLTFLAEKKVKIYLTIDSIGHLVQHGRWFHSLEKDYALLKEIHTSVAAKAPIHLMGVDISHYQNAGANIVQQLAYGLAHAQESLNYFTKVSPGSRSKSFNRTQNVSSFPITFKVAVGSNYFFEIAKLRALRWLWKNVAQEYGYARDCHILAFPTRRNKALYDSHANLLRTTTECMSALLGGADTICNLPYDALYQQNNPFSERIARNQLLLLKKESQLQHAAQIAQGAYYIESLTQQLAEKALALFKSLEKSGGFLKALQQGRIQQEINESASREQRLFDEGQLRLVGINSYPNPEDPLKDQLKHYPFSKKQSGGSVVVPIPERRLAEALEQKRWHGS